MKLFTGYNCRDVLNIGLMRPIFSPTEYIQIKGRGTRLFTFKVGHTTYEKACFFLLDFCAVAEFFREKYDYTIPLKLPREPGRETATAGIPGGSSVMREDPPGGETSPPSPREIPVWEGHGELVARAVIEVGPDGEKVDVMTFRGSYEKDVKEFVAATPEMKEAVEVEDDDTVETIMHERFYHQPKMFYSPDKLVVSYGVPASTAAFVYHAVGLKPLPAKEDIVHDTVDSIAARFNLRYAEQKWVDATAQLLADDPRALQRFIDGDLTIFTAAQFNKLGGLAALTQFAQRDDVFDALRQSTLVRQSLLAAHYQ